MRIASSVQNRDFASLLSCQEIRDLQAASSEDQIYSINYDPLIKKCYLSLFDVNFETFKR